MNLDLRESVRQLFLDNARRMFTEHQAEIEGWKNLVKADGNFIPPYIPYIGPDYFSSQTKGCRILAYALSQNIQKTDECAAKWARDWKEGDGTIALDRQNQCTDWAAMNPFDTGHIPILASLLRSFMLGRKPRSDETIYRKVSATNLSKFSFRSSNGRWTTDNDSSLACCWEWFSRLEVEKLDPDVILCCGRRVWDIISKQAPSVLRRAKVVLVAFPSLRVINRHYHRNKPFRAEHLRAPKLKEYIAAVDMKRLCGVVDRDEYYFAEMFARMQQQVDESRQGKQEPENRCFYYFLSIPVLFKPQSGA